MGFKRSAAHKRFLRGQQALKDKQCEQAHGKKKMTYAGSREAVENGIPNPAFCTGCHGWYDNRPPQ